MNEYLTFAVNNGVAVALLFYFIHYNRKQLEIQNTILVEIKEAVKNCPKKV